MLILIAAPAYSHGYAAPAIVKSYAPAIHHAAPYTAYHGAYHAPAVVHAAPIAKVAAYAPYCKFPLY